MFFCRLVSLLYHNYYLLSRLLSDFELTDPVINLLKSGLANRFEEYPKQRELIRLKDDLIASTNTPPM